MTNFSFPTVELPGVGLCVTRRVLTERTGVSSSQLTQFQNTSLVRDQDYFYRPNPSTGMACNFYRVAVIQRMAQVFPTLEAQQMAVEVTAFLSAHSGYTPALPPGSEPWSAQTVVSPELAYSQPFEPGQSYREPYYAQATGPQTPMPHHDDPRVVELSHAIARNLQPQMLQSPAPSTTMTQAELLQAARSLQTDAVDYVKVGFQLASTAQSQTADAIRRSRPNVTNTTTHNAYNAFEFLEQKMSGLSPLQFGLLASGVFCVVATFCYAVVSMHQSNPPAYTPTSMQTEVRRISVNG